MVCHSDWLWSAREIHLFQNVLFLFRLCEPKKDLIARVVKIIGKKKAIELLMETAEVEQNGGLLIMVRKNRDLLLELVQHLLTFTDCSDAVCTSAFPSKCQDLCCHVILSRLLSWVGGERLLFWVGLWQILTISSKRVKQSLTPVYGN